MNSQINLRLSKELLDSANKQAKIQGFQTLQDFIKETLREKLFEEDLISKEELSLVKGLIKISEEKSLYGSEEDLFKKLRN